jgi:hypothetical protein
VRESVVSASAARRLRDGADPDALDEATDVQPRLRTVATATRHVREVSSILLMDTDYDPTS